MLGQANRGKLLARLSPHVCEAIREASGSAHRPRVSPQPRACHPLRKPRVSSPLPRGGFWALHKPRSSRRTSEGRALRPLDRRDISTLFAHRLDIETWMTKLTTERRYSCAADLSPPHVGVTDSMAASGKGRCAPQSPPKSPVKQLSRDGAQSISANALHTSSPMWVSTLSFCSHFSLCVRMREIFLVSRFCRRNEFWKRDAQWQPSSSRALECVNRKPVICNQQGKKMWRGDTRACWRLSPAL